MQGEERISEVTGKPEPYYPAWKRNVFRSVFLRGKSVMFWLRCGYVLCLFTLTLLAWQVLRDGARYFGLSSCGLPLGLSSARVSGFMFFLVIELKCGRRKGRKSVSQRYLNVLK